MTAAQVTAEPRRGVTARLIARAGHRPLGAHVAVLAVVLLIGLLVSGPRVAYTSDEGAAVLQARLLEHDGTWLYRYPLTALDAEDGARPFVRGDLGTKGLAPYAKHPLYPVILAGALRIGGEAGLGLVGVLGTLGAATASALLARRLRPSLAVATLWIVGIGSPLLFDGYVVLAHALAAAAAGAGVLALLDGLDPGRSRLRRAVGLAAAAILVMASSMLRTEALFLAPALAFACLVLAVLRRAPVFRLALAAAAALFGGVMGWVLDRVIWKAIIGQPIAGQSDLPPSSWIAGRWQSVGVTWFQASYHGRPVADLALVLAALILFVAAVVLRMRPHRRDLAALALLGAVACFLVRLVVGPPGSIPGLVIAFPVGWAALWMLGRQSLAGVTATLLTVTSACMTLAILLAQYPRGGGIEWGGRYFAVVLPLVVPVLVAAAAPVLRSESDDRLARVGPVAVVALTVLPALIAFQALRSVHDVTADVLAGIRAAAAEAGVPVGAERPVVLSPNRLLPQIAYRDFDRYDWVVPDDVTSYGPRLAAAGIKRVVLVSPEMSFDLANLPGWHVVSGPRPGLPLDVLVIEHE